MIGDRIAVLEKFFNVKKPKNMNPVEWMDKLYEMEMEWEEENQREFPLQDYEGEQKKKNELECGK